MFAEPPPVSKRIPRALWFGVTGLVPQLRVLDLEGTRVGDAGLANLVGLLHLTDLSLDETAITDNGLVHLRGLTGLEHLSLNGTKVTDGGMKHLEGLLDQDIDLTISGDQFRKIVEGKPTSDE